MTNMEIKPNRLQRWARAASLFVTRYEQLPARFWTALLTGATLMPFILWTLAGESIPLEQRFLFFLLTVLSCFAVATFVVSRQPSPYERTVRAREQHFAAKGALVRDSYEEALGLAASACTLDPENPDIHNVIGRAQFCLGNYKSAGEAFTRAIEFYPRPRAKYLRNRALAYAYQGRNTEAIKDFESSLGAVPNNPNALAGIARVKFLQGDYEGALRDAERALEYNSRHTWALAMTVAAAHKLNRNDISSARMKSFEKLNLNSAGAFFAKAVISAQIGKPKDALDALAIAVRKDIQYAAQWQHEMLLEPVWSIAVNDPRMLRTEPITSQY